ncbi:MAG: hypothetical protein JNL60_03320 [Bacteroidia bacterium]|nr:hypothetical protein [Bacteroidia bacterium]
MILACIYLLIILWLIYFNGFFGLFKDSVLSRKKFTLFFFIKALAIPTFYLAYLKFYGGIADLDTGKFHHDALVLSGIAKTDLALYVKTLLGFQSDDRNSYDYYMLYSTQNWDNGTMKDFLYNDNRIVIRVHSLLNFIAFNSYFVHALLNCFLSFTGIYFIYRSLNSYFVGKETLFMSCFCFFPALWFHTGALLKEGIVLFVLGSTLLLLKQLANAKLSPIKVPVLLFLLFICFLLKAYLLLFAVFCFGFFFLLERRTSKKYNPIIFLGAIVLCVALLNIISICYKQRSLFDAALKQERIFTGVAKGGIFLYGPDRFIRLEYDTSLVKRSLEKTNRYSIRANARYIYWKDEKSLDTLRCDANLDTTSTYALAYMIKPSQSNLDRSDSKNTLTLFGTALLNTLTYPLFKTNKTAIQWLASFENLLIVSSLFICFIGLLFVRKSNLPVVVFLVFALGVCLLVGITSPNGGAIFRYRSPLIPFILLAGVYYLPDAMVLRKKNHPYNRSR